MRNVAGAEVGGNLAGVEFVLECYLDGIFAKGNVC